MKTINWEITYAKNDDVYQYGDVEIPKDINESAEWTYYKEDGMPAPHFYIIHAGIGITQIGATDQQLEEIDDFRMQIQHTYCDVIDEIILLAGEDENDTYYVGDLIIKIGDD